MKARPFVVFDVTAIVVSYCSRSDLPGCLGSLDSQRADVDLEALLVDNASTDGSADYAEEAFPQVHVIRSDRNLGFAAANNVAITQSTGRYVFLLNPDTVMQAGSLLALVRFMDSNPGVGAAGPRLLNDDGSLQYSIGRFPTLANQIGHHLGFGRLAPRTRRFAEIDRRREDYDVSHEVDWVLGAALIVRREAIDAVGLLDESFFMFSEEEDWCLRFRAAGWPVHYACEPRVVHVGRRGPGSPEVYWMYIESRIKFIRKHHGRLAAAVSRLLTIAGLALKWIACVGLTLACEDKASKTIALAYRVSLGRLVFGGGSA